MTAGLVLTLNRDDAIVSTAVAELTARPEITLGDREGRYLAAVMETPNSRASRDLHRWIESLPGVDYVDVVYVGFDDQCPTPSNLSPQFP